MINVNGQKGEEIRILLMALSYISSFHLPMQYLSCVMRRPVFGVSDQVRLDRAVQPQKMARGLKLWIQKVEGLY